jgi:hypothetical protein
VQAALVARCDAMPDCILCATVCAMLDFIRGHCKAFVTLMVPRPPTLRTRRGMVQTLILQIMLSMFPTCAPAMPCLKN